MKNCGCCQKLKRCALVEVSAYDPETGEDPTNKLHMNVCGDCADLLAPVVSATIQSWCREKPGRVAKVRGVKV